MNWRGILGSICFVGFLGLSSCGFIFNRNLSLEEVTQLGKEITVIIEGCGAGSGFLYQREGELYSVLSANHVIDEKIACLIITHDGTSYKASQITRPVAGIDLAIIQFNSKVEYKLGELGDSTQLKPTNQLYVAGAPGASEAIPARLVQTNPGRLIQKVDQFKDGYTIMYDNSTLPGMSGGPVLNEQGKVVGIHGRGDRSQDQSKTGRNMGMPIEIVKDPAQYAVVKKENPKEAAEKIFFEGFLLEIQGKRQDALEKYSEAIKLNPNYDAAYSSRGNLYSLSKDKDKALADYNQAIKINPNNSAAYIGRGSVFYGIGDKEKALTDYNQAIKINPNNSVAYTVRGIIFDDKREYDKAITDYNQAIKINPNNSFAYNNRGNSYSNKGEYDKALADYNQAIKINPIDSSPYNGRGTIYSEKGEHDKAIINYNQAIKLDPNFVLAYNNRGNSYNRKGEDDKAITDYNQAIKLDPNSALAYNGRGISYGKKGEYDKAIIDYTQAIKLNSNFVLAYNNRGISYGKKGEYDKAIIDYSQAIKLDPNYAQGYASRGVAYYDKGDNKKALDDLRKAAELYRQRGNIDRSDQILEVIRQLEGN